MTWKQEKTSKFNEENLPEDTRAMSLLTVAQDSVDKAAFNVRIPYEDLNYLQCTTVDALLLLASGLKPKDVSILMSKRYDTDFTVEKVYSAKKNHPAEFGRMLTFYREIFLNQQVQSLEQLAVEKLSMSMPTLEIDSFSDALKAAQMLKIMGEVRKTKEEDGGYKSIDKDALKALENKMKTLAGK